MDYLPTEEDRCPVEDPQVSSQVRRRTRVPDEVCDPTAVCSPKSQTCKVWRKALDLPSIGPLILNSRNGSGCGGGRLENPYLILAASSWLLSSLLTIDPRFPLISDLSFLGPCFCSSLFISSFYLASLQEEICSALEFLGK
ncbi:hypothetical protein RvY_15971 [Ramazzottius varieornatus]|uniref:Uncharacterized protein n=1 Tax=Ramazzottius varieornatus TaxID=947166 RepID=A0A1D1VWS8_RAMVA|nr:hypothetical protein RvY_15971 [Ramazzottius varieornatus]